MSAPSESATSPSPCACTNISLMQLFHELKQKFPGVPDHVVSNTIELYCHDKQACETHLHSEVKASLTHAYHASSSAAARQLNELKLNPPGKCRNQPIVKHEAPKSTAVQSVTCQGPQTAVISIETNNKDKDKQQGTDANQNVVELKNDENERNNNASPVTVINIDNCYAKYSAESPSDLELTNENTSAKKSNEVNTRIDKVDKLTAQESLEQQESTNYRILKSNKILSNLHERLEKGKEKKTIKKEETQTQNSLKKEETQNSLKKEESHTQSSLKKEETQTQSSLKKEEAQTQNSLKKEEPPEQEKEKETVQEKPKRPNTLDFIKPNPGIAFKPTLKEPEAESCRTVSPAPSQKPDAQPKETNKPGAFKPERGYPLNLSVNVNCHMDYGRGYDPWLEDYDSPRAITSVNLTVCTPTSNMASPVRDTREDDGVFDGHVTVTVSPSTARAPRRPAPPPPSRPSRLESPRPTRVAPEPPGSTHDRSLIERQKERLGRLAKALAQEKGRLAQLTRETQILAAPPPPAVAAARLKEDVEKLRDQCNTLAKRLEMGGNEPVEDADNFYSNIYTGQRPPSSWQCHICTFRNHPLLDKCEQCEMPRILVGTSPSRTHDSGFGSFRDRNRHFNPDTTAIEDGIAVCSIEDFGALPRLET